jgi:hypothetical protein
LLDPISIAEGAISSVVGAKTKDALDNALQLQEPTIKDLLVIQNILLTRMLEQLSIQDNPDLTENIQFTADTSGTMLVGSYQIPEYPRNHLIILFPACTLNVKLDTMAMFQKTISNPGWYQVDLPSGTQISSTTTIGTKLKWSDFPGGSSF